MNQKTRLEKLEARVPKPLEHHFIDIVVWGNSNLQPGWKVENPEIHKTELATTTITFRDTAGNHTKT